MTRCYKAVTLEHKANMANNDFAYTVGEWHTIEGELIPCNNGLHACERAIDILSYLKSDSDIVYVSEGSDEKVSEGNKTVFRSLRLVKPTMLDDVTLRLFAADCAERALSNVENPDERSLAAVEAARLFAVGEIDDAARSTACSTAYYASYYAAYSDEHDWQNKLLEDYMQRGAYASKWWCEHVGETYEGGSWA